MTKEFEYKDEKLNQFKLMIYNWNIDDAIKYYKNDSFCHDYCIDKNYEYGCDKQANQCPFEHSQTMDLYNLIVGSYNKVEKQQQHNCRTARLLCLYLMYKKAYNDKNSMLFMYYGNVMYTIGTTKQDYLKSETSYLRSLKIDNNNGNTHRNYATLLELRLYNFDKAEYHYEKALQLFDPDGTRCYNFAMFLKVRQKKYSKSLIYCNKACQLQPNVSSNHELKGSVLCLLNNFEESIDTTMHALKLNQWDGCMNNNDRTSQAKQLIEQSIEKYIIEQLKGTNYFDHINLEGYKLIEWLYDNQLLSIKRQMFTSNVTMQMLFECNREDFDQLVKEMKLKTSIKIKFRKAFQNFKKQQQQTSDREKNEKQREQEKEKEKENLHVEVEEKSTNLVPAPSHRQSQAKGQQLRIEPKIYTRDDVSVFSGVSAISAPFVVNSALIVFLGIGDYHDKLQNLSGVSKDYNNIFNAFVGTWKYTAFYKTDKNITIYSNEIETVQSNNNYKLYWTIDEIEKFVEEARMYTVFNKHSGLIFFISSHGDTGKVIYDSNMDGYELLDIFKMFQPHWGQLLETYTEIPKISKRLFQIPKIFFVDSCRGSTSAKIVNIERDAKDAQEKIVTKNNNFSGKKSVSKCNEKVVLKSVSKETAELLSTNYSNFCQIWANVDGFSVADGAINGGLFLRNVAKLFQHKKWILNHNLNDIIFKIRDYTKREATLIGLVNFTQLVENEGTMERPVRFDVFEENVVYKSTQEFLDKVDGIEESEHEEEDDELDKVTITNLSSTDKIGVLVENEQSNEDRTQLLQSLINNESKENNNNSNDVDDNLLFTSKGYQLICGVTNSGSESAKFVKTWDYTFVTLINITKKELICDRKRYFEDYLYFENDLLHPIIQYKPECSNKHTLKEVNGMDDNKFDCNNCESRESNVYFHCYKCNYSLCQACCHLEVCVKKQQS